MSNKNSYIPLIILVALASHAAQVELPPAITRKVDYEKDIQPILQKNCYSCHGPKKQKGLFRLDQKSVALRGGEKVDILPGKSAESPLIHRVAGVKADEVMPPDGDTLSAAQISLLRAWIDQGANWPETAVVADTRLDWWSLKPLAKPPVPVLEDSEKKFARTQIDAFVLAKLREKKLAPSTEADRRTLMRRVYFDLTGLPPSPEELAAFVTDADPQAYEKLVDKLLASQRYGERWARHWMDAVHFAETHGHDQDRVRPNAWPYRDYLIAAFNHDTPYARFVQEQLAADVLFPDQPQLTPALGFISAGPWDESSLRDIREDSMCRQVGYYLDRDDMVTQTIQTFASSTVHCARCHDHKFDPISQADYYALQAVFAGLGRADRAFDTDPKIHAKRRELSAQLTAVNAKDAKKIEELLTPQTREEMNQWTALHRNAIQNKVEWTVLETEIVSKENVPFTKLPDGSHLADGVTPETDTYTLTAGSSLKEITGVRLEVMADERLPHNGPGRQIDNGNLHLSEIAIHATPADKLAEPKRLTIARAVADFNQQNWTIEHAIDGKMETAWGIFPETGKSHYAVFEFKEPLKSNAGASLKVVLEQNHGRKHVIGRLRISVTGSLSPAGKSELPAPIVKILAAPEEGWTAEQKTQLTAHFLKGVIEKQIAALPKPQLVYAGAKDFVADGTHRPVPTPRPVFELRRGDILKPGAQAQPGALTCVPKLPARFDLANPNDEGQRRAALAQWLSDPANPLTWRSIVNRVWHYHFGRGIAAMPNDFGRMGTPPTHPELIDWLAAEFRDSGGSLKKLHRLIVTSATYRQSSANQPAFATIDADNLYLWRMNRTRLDAECFRDAALQASGKLDLAMGGPSVQYFAMSPGVHVTPVVDYTKFDWNVAGAGRRSVYRFIFRTLPDPFMDALDCADASALTAARNVSLTPLQALALLNDGFVLKQSEFLAKRLEKEGDAKAQIALLYKLTLLREPKASESAELLPYAQKFGMVNVCRLILNCSEFLFVD